jgi:carbon storage regulator
MECFMLVLTRKYQEKIRIGENITITVLRMKGKAVRLGIEAPGNVPVIRGELAFDVPAEAGEAEFAAVDGESEEAGSTRSGRLVAGVAGMTSEWATDTNPALARVGEKREAAKVAFGRVPREQMSDLLPKIAAGTAPLRAIMDRRS